MGLTPKLSQISFSACIAIQSSSPVIVSAFVHTASDAGTNILSALPRTIQSRFGLSETVLALLIATLSLSALVTQPHHLNRNSRDSV
jgi:hypothetical protein